MQAIPPFHRDEVDDTQEHLRRAWMRQGQAFLDDYPDQAAAILQSWLAALAKTADEVERLGNPTTATYMREIAHDAALEALGKTYRHALRALLTERTGDLFVTH